MQQQLEQTCKEGSAEVQSLRQQADQERQKSQSAATCISELEQAVETASRQQKESAEAADSYRKRTNALVQELGEARRHAEHEVTVKSEEAQKAIAKSAEIQQQLTALTKERDEARQQQQEFSASMKADFKDRTSSLEGRLQEASRESDRLSQRNRSLSQQVNYQEQLLAGREADFGRRIDAAEASYKEAGERITGLLEQVASLTKQLDGSKAEQTSLLQQQEAGLRKGIEQSQQHSKQLAERTAGLQDKVNQLTKQLQEVTEQSAASGSSKDAEIKSLSDSARQDQQAARAKADDLRYALWIPWCMAMSKHPFARESSTSKALVHCSRCAMA